MPYRLVTFKAVPELLTLLGKEADEKGVARSELIAKILADHYGRPELGRIPRVSIGRPRRYDTQEVPA